MRVYSFLILLLINFSFLLWSDTKPAIELLPHQKKTIDYLVSNDDIRGLLVSHYMGMGKTITAIGFAEHYPNRPIYVLAPYYLEDHWREQANKFGADWSRYQFVSLEDAPKKLLHTKLNTAILIVDEAHNLIKMMRSPDSAVNQAYTKLYHSLRKAHKIMLLTGTPVYGEISDIAFLLNLASGENLITFNQEEFRITYSQKKDFASFWRGYLTESNILYVAMPTFLTLWGFAIVASPIVILPAFALGFAALPVVNQAIAPLSNYRLREVNFDSLKPVTRKYVSYAGSADVKQMGFPEKVIHEKVLRYNPAQMDFFLKFVEESLNSSDVSMLLREGKSMLPMNDIEINSTAIQRNVKNRPGSGREIGNFALALKEGNNVVPEKFEQIRKMILEKPGKVAIYSNYYENGLVLLANYLKKEGLGDQMALIDPHAPLSQQTLAIEQYNGDKKRILFLPPHLTEGINLLGTRQFFILEPPLSNALLEQAIARAVRFGSHTRLPEEERRVDVTLFRMELPSWDFGAYRMKRENWNKHYGELSDWSNWGVGRAQIDPHYRDKLFSPDDYAWQNLQSLKRNLDQIQVLLSKNSIESL